MASVPISIRDADVGDAAFLWDALALAADWQRDRATRARDEVARDPELARYLIDWPRATDAGVIASQDGRALGAAWLRFWPEHERGYGFVSDEIPELSIAVLPAFRGQGIGTALLRALIERARAAGVEALSLSVAPDNPARHLYERVGFLPVGVERGVMVVHVGTVTPGKPE